MEQLAYKRLQKELVKLHTDFKDSKYYSIGSDLEPLQGQAKFISNLKIGLTCAENTVYAGEKYVLNFKFPKNYPIKPPIVTFIGGRVPLHEHIYSNGHICVSILYDDWSPTVSITGVVYSIHSLLSSATRKSKPPGNDSYVKRYGNGDPSNNWVFHDDKC